jgi:hypothetical protein
MARKVKNCKASTLNELVDEIESELSEESPTSYQVTSPIFDSSDNKFRVIIVMETFEA